MDDFAGGTTHHQAVPALEEAHSTVRAASDNCAAFALNLDGNNIGAVSRGVARRDAG